MRQYIEIHYRSGNFGLTRNRDDFSDSDSDESDGSSKNQGKKPRIESEEDDDPSEHEYDMDIDFEALTLGTPPQVKHEKVINFHIRTLQKKFPKNVLYRHKSMAILVLKSFDEDKNSEYFRVFKIVPDHEELEEVSPFDSIDHEQYTVVYEPEPNGSSAGPSGSSAGPSGSSAGPSSSSAGPSSSKDKPSRRRLFDD